MKIVKINESQKKRLFEAYREGFSLKELSALGKNGWGAQYDYCVKWLGEPDGFGSSRCVFTLNDNMILKLATGNQYKAGIAQNRQEYEMFETWHSPLLVRIFSVDENYAYLICENVVPAKKIDFEKILGLPFNNTYYQNSQKEKDDESRYGSDTEVGFNNYFDNIKEPYQNSEYGVYDVLCYIESNYSLDEPYFDKDMENIINQSEWLTEFKEFVKNSGLCDFCHTDNFGVVNRDGNLQLVILDSGFNINIWDNYYAN